MTPVLFCHRCGHIAEKHDGEAGCTDCPCAQTYEAINPQPPTETGDPTQ